MSECTSSVWTWRGRCNNQPASRSSTADGALDARRRDSRTTTTSSPRSTPYVRGDCLVAIDAPLIVTNSTGQRPAETGTERRLRALRGGRASGEHRQPCSTRRVARASPIALGLDMDPTFACAEAGNRGVSAPGDDRAVRARPNAEVQARRPCRSGAAELLRLMDAHRGARGCDPPLRRDRSARPG